jgi:hypothetical protein
VKARCARWACLYAPVFALLTWLLLFANLWIAGLALVALALIAHTYAASHTYRRRHRR